MRACYSCKALSGGRYLPCFMALHFGKHMYMMIGLVFNIFIANRHVFMALHFGKHMYMMIGLVFNICTPNRHCS
jgi:small basic protein